MRFEPAIDRSLLLEVVRRRYHLPASEIDFLPVGLGSACYMLHTTDERRHFLKLWPNLRSSTPEAAQQYERLALTAAMHDLLPGVRVPYPIRTADGDLWADVAGVPFAIMPLLLGEHPPSPWPVRASVALGKELAAIHGATAELRALAPARERLDIWYEGQLRHNLQRAALLGADARPGLLAVRDWVLRRRDEVTGQLARLHSLQAAARQVETPFVLCHADLHVHNVLLDAQGGISVLDWDDARLAPPEHDLWYPLLTDKAAESYAPLIAAYRSHGGRVRLYREHLAFYLLRRFLEDLAVNLRDLLAPDADAREDGTLLHAMDAWSAVYWSRLDQMLVIADAALHDA